ncbi:SDR family oxidoreductase [Thermus caldilimi]|uniref:SDR family oxidoreductase n=1 Tax=Thermus caldilimi TaxID=2483360 RepID=UPI001F0FC3BD|nr:NAD(P)-dependent oxidoreductase [Thermus caldilimi]
MLLTGGTGRLGQELQRLLPGLIAPTREEMDITQPEAVDAAFRRYRPEVVVHAAAYTKVDRAEVERELCWRVNVVGTRHLVRASQRWGAFFIHISTDYVFEGTQGMYAEEDTPGPVRNYYALTKLVAEEAVRALPAHLVIRTSFRTRPWPYPVAFTDMYTSQDYLDLIAPEIALAVQRYRDIPYDTLHIATERKSVYELARQSRPDVRPASRREAPIALPEDVSLDTRRWQELKRRWLK